jgi:PAS domain S-box-containing protein
MTDKGSPNRFDELRARAERILDAASTEARIEVKHNVSELIEELRTHQIELELQNEELQATQRALEASRVRYKELFDFAPATYVIFNEDGLVRDINVTGVSLLRVTRQRILNKPFWLYVRSEHRDALAHHLRAVTETQSQKACELELQRKDGSRLWARLHSTPRQGPDEENRIRTALLDITERKELEQDLVAAREKAEHATEAQRAFLSNMSHEIRTPLTSVIGFAEALGEMVEAGEKYEFAQSIRSSGRRLLDTLNSILDYTRIQNQDDEIEVKRLDVVEQVADGVRIMQPQAETKGIRLDFDGNDEAVFAPLHEDYFGRVLNNLVSNAIKYTEEGAVTVRVVQRDDEVEIQVEDTGVGIEEALLDRIFDPFLQADFGPHRQHDGVGLGLAITKKLVDRMSGRMTVASEVGAGSRFSVFFPRLAAEAPAAAPRDRPADPHRVSMPSFTHLSGSDILVVEDNAETRQLVRLFLRSMAHVEDAANSKEALEQVRSQAFDAVLLDINLGEDCTGLDLLEMIRDVDGYSTCPIIAFTAYALPGDKERFMQAGFDGYVQKPFTKHQLLWMLDRALTAPSRRSSSTRSAR